MDNELQILLQMLYAGTGVDQALSDLAGLEEIAAEMGAGYDRAGAQADALAQSLLAAGRAGDQAGDQLAGMGQELPAAEVDAFGQEVDDVGDAARRSIPPLEDFGEKTDGVGEKSERSKERVRGFGDQMFDLNQTMEATQRVAQIVGDVFVKSFELAREGDAINRTRERLDALAAGIDSTAEALTDRLAAATRSSVDDVTLMNGALTFLQMGFVNSEDGAERLMQRILLLKQPTESVGEAINNFSLMLANQSVARLDSFGLSSGRVRAQIEQLMASTAGMTREQAFMQATFSEMDRAIESQGLSVDDLENSYGRLETAVTNAKSALMAWLDEGLSPVLDAITGANATTVTDIVTAQQAAAQSLEDYIVIGQRLSDVGNEWMGLGVVVTGNEEAHHAALVRVAQDIVNASGSFAEFERSFNAAFNWNARYNLMGLSGDLWEFYKNARQVESLSDALENAYEPADSLATATKELAANAEDAGIAITDGTGAIVGWVGMMGELDAGISTAALSARELAGATYEVRDAAGSSLPGIRSAWEAVFGATDSARDMLERYKGLLNDSETAEQRLAVVNLAEAWGIVTEAEAEAQRQIIEMEQTHDRIVNNMATVVSVNLAGGWHNAWSAANSYRELLLQLEGITPPTPGGAYPGGAYPGGGSPPPGGAGGSGDDTGSYGGPPPGAVPPPASGGTGGYGGPGGPTPQAAMFGPTGSNVAAPVAGNQVINIYIDPGNYMQVQGQVTATAGMFADQLGVRG